MFEDVVLGISSISVKEKQKQSSEKIKNTFAEKSSQHTAFWRGKYWQSVSQFLSRGIAF